MTIMMAKGAMVEVIDDFIQNNLHHVLKHEVKVSIVFGNNTFTLGKEGFTVVEIISNSGEENMCHYKNMNEDKLDVLTRLIPEFRKACWRLSKR